jgi:putative transposase
MLGTAFRQCLADWPFRVNAIVLLPDHLHTIWTLPLGDDRYSGRWSVIKKSFTSQFLAAGGIDWSVSDGKRQEGRRGVWQRRFWEHVIEDEDDFEKHFDYIHYNPVKHQLANCPSDWEPSSFHRWVKQGVYEEGWGRREAAVPPIARSKDDFGEPDDSPPAQGRQGGPCPT